MVRRWVNPWKGGSGPTKLTLTWSKHRSGIRHGSRGCLSVPVHLGRLTLQAWSGPLPDLLLQEWPDEPSPHQFDWRPFAWLRQSLEHLAAPTSRNHGTYLIRGDITEDAVLEGSILQTQSCCCRPESLEASIPPLICHQESTINARCTELTCALERQSATGLSLSATCCVSVIYFEMAER